MNIKCFFGLHDYRPVKTENYNDVSYMSESQIQKFGGVPSTNVTFICRSCSKVKVKRLYNAGHLSVEDFQEGNP